MIAERQAWLESRRKGLGGTDLAAIAGHHHYKTALDVYLEKTGAKPDDEAGRKAQAGIALEPLVREWASAEIGKPIALGRMIYDEEHPFLFVNLDGETDDMVVEIKTMDFATREQWGEPGTDQIPIAYLYQVYWQLGLAKKDRALVVRCDRGTMELEYFYVESDKAIFKLMRKMGIRFWQDHVLAKVPPDPEGRDGDNIIHLFPQGTPDILVSDEAVDALASEMYDNRATVKPLDKRYEELKSQMKVAIGAAAGIETMIGKFTLTRSAGNMQWKPFAIELGAELGAPKELVDRLQSEHQGKAFTTLRVPF